MRFPKAARLALSAASLLTLAACTVGPDFVASQPAPPAAGPFVAAASPAFTAEQPSGQWWRLYQDPILDGLVADALANNTDLRLSLIHI